MTDKKDKRYRRIGWIWSLTVQLMMLLIFYFLVAWKEPFPPIPTYGIEMSFGTVEESAPQESSENSQEPQQAANNPEEQIAVSEEEPLETEVEPEVNTEEILDQPDPTEILEELSEEVSDIPSPDFVEEVEPEPIIEEVEPEPIIEDVIEKPIKEEVEEISQPDSKEEEDVEEENDRSNENSLSDTSTDDKPNADNSTNSNGETNGNGEIGTEVGTLDDRAIMGKAGTPDGASLQLTGWSWDSQPKPQDTSSESGVIKYEISVDADGYIQNVSVVTSTVSPLVERYYRQSVERLTFSRTSNNSSASISKGYITFIIKSK